MNKQLFLAGIIVSVTLPGIDVAAQGVDGIERGTRPSEPHILTVPRVPSDLIITPVLDRPLDIDDGPQVTVESFQLEGFRDIDKHGIKLIEIEDILEKARKKRNNIFTIGQLQVVVDEITTYYRSHGLILAQALLPAQDVKRGKVLISLLEGRIAKIVIEGNLRYSTELLTKPFNNQLNKTVVSSEVEQGLFTLSDLPGLQIYGLFRPGTEVGTTELLLKVEDEEPYIASVRLDNHGSRMSGKHRVVGDITINNPSGLGDQLYFQAQKTFDPDEAWFGRISYNFPIINHNYRMGASFSRNDYNIGYKLKELDFSGVTEDFDFFIERKIIRSRSKNLSLKLSMELRQYQLERDGSLEKEDDLTVVRIQLAYDNLDTVLKPYLGGGLNLLSFDYSQGIKDLFGSMEDNEDLVSRVGNNNKKASGYFEKFELTAVRLQQLDKLAKGHSVLLKFAWQYSPNMLVPMEQFSLGGPSSVRAYPASEYLGDKGFFLSAEYLVSAPGFSDQAAFKGRTWGEILQFSLFYDFGAVWRHSPAQGEDSYMDLAGFGIGLHLNMPGEFEAHLTVATPNTPEDATNEHHPQIFGSFKYYLH